MPKPLLAEGSDRQSQLVERGGNSKACWLLDRELVVAAPKVLHQGMPRQHDRGTAVLFEPAHRPEPRLQPPVVAFDAVVGVLVGPMPRRRQQVIEPRRSRRVAPPAEVVLPAEIVPPAEGEATPPSSSASPAA